MTKQRPKSAAQKMRDYRARLRAQGLRQVQFWIPDTRTPEFAAKAREESMRIARSEGEKEDLEFAGALFEDMLNSPDRNEAR